MASSVQISHQQSSDHTRISSCKKDKKELIKLIKLIKLIIFINGGAMGLLQVATDESSTNDAYRGTTILCFWVFTLVSTVLRVCEVKLRNKPTIRNFVGHVSHLFGALAALMLISLISRSFTLIVVPLWLVWFVVVMYVSFSELVFPEDNDTDLPV
ncbi:hypothetical protein Bca4012_073065 [Brassica carinata]|uniref:BnaC05g29080D protein n=5 Tax=Brassica TaxID=3705 RepID=A0A078GZ96_BRANA|nr:hypothetical protein HID58_067148 [Brassica napus]CAF1930789.1 unnamed protein product [Brassica napus]CDY29928.1 BnaC05g29080D [Brassica napus]VDD45129.1 unnamed protein product [Brassica oleracea]